MTVFIPCKTRRAAVRRATWASVVVRVVGGYTAFEFATDAEIFRNTR